MNNSSSYSIFDIIENFTPQERTEWDKLTKAILDANSKFQEVSQAYLVERQRVSTFTVEMGGKRDELLLAVGRRLGVPERQG
jgi:hypothetical protein